MSLPLGDLVGASEEADYARVGYHHVHTAEPARLPEIARAFREHGYLLEMMTCQDRRHLGEAEGSAGPMRLVYQFNRIDAVDRHLVHADIPWGEPAPTVTGVYKAADWFEREVLDMYGVPFEGHPNPKRLLLPEDSDFHALLKDFGRIEDAPPEADGATDADQGEG